MNATATLLSPALSNPLAFTRGTAARTDPIRRADARTSPGRSIT